MKIHDCYSFLARLGSIARLTVALTAAFTAAHAESAASPSSGKETVATSQGVQTQPVLVRKALKKALRTKHDRNPELTPEERKSMPRYAKIDIAWLELRGTGQPELERTVNALLRENARMPENIKTMAANPFSDITSSIHRAFLHDGLLSVAYEVYDYGHGAANGSSSINAVNFDLQQGKALTLEDLFPVSSLPALSLLVQSELERKGRGAQFRGIASDNCFFFDRRALTLCFDQGDIDARYEGVAEAKLPWARVAPLLARNETTKRVLKFVEKKATAGAAPVSSR